MYPGTAVPRYPVRSPPPTTISPPAPNIDPISQKGIFYGLDLRSYMQNNRPTFSKGSIYWRIYPGRYYIIYLHINVPHSYHWNLSNECLGVCGSFVPDGCTRYSGTRAHGPSPRRRAASGPGRQPPLRPPGSQRLQKIASRTNEHGEDDGDGVHRHAANLVLLLQRAPPWWQHLVIRL